MKIGNTIKEKRLQKGMTQEELALKSDITVRTVQRIESGEVDPRSFTLQAIASALEVDYNELVSVDEPSKSEGISSNDTFWLATLHFSGIYQKENLNLIQDAFDIHYAMSGPDTIQDGKNVGTQYTTVFDITNRKLYFRTLKNRNIREVDFNSFKDDCSIKAKMLNILTTGVGNVTDLFVNYSTEENMNVMHRAFSTEANKLPQQMLDIFQQYIDSFGCKK